jgi:hypothetical protein
MREENRVYVLDSRLTMATWSPSCLIPLSIDTRGGIVLEYFCPLYSPASKRLTSHVGYGDCVARARTKGVTSIFDRLGFVRSDFIYATLLLGDMRSRFIKNKRWETARVRNLSYTYGKYNENYFVQVGQRHKRPKRHPPGAMYWFEQGNQYESPIFYKPRTRTHPHTATAFLNILLLQYLQPHQQAGLYTCQRRPPFNDSLSLVSIRPININHATCRRHIRDLSLLSLTYDI